LISPIPPLDYGHDSWIHDFTEMLGSRRVLGRVLQLYRRHPHNASTWAFNGAQRASPMVMMRPSAGKDLSPEYAKRCRALSLMRDRVEALGRERFAELGAGRSYDEVIREFDAAIQAVDRRSAVFRSGPLKRRMLAVELLAGGHYRHFLGWRSFVKDLVR